MYQIEDITSRTDYIRAMNTRIQEHAVRVFVKTKSMQTEREFSQASILEGSLSIQNQCCENSGLSFGGVYVGEMRCTFINYFQNIHNIIKENDSWIGTQVRIVFRIKARNSTEIDARNYEDVPMGTFTIVEANKTRIGVEVVAYDNMAKFDKALPELTENDTVNGTFWDHINRPCAWCEVELGMTEEECNALPNGQMNLDLSLNRGLATWRDYISALAEAVGGFATMSRDGELVVKAFGQNVTPVDSISDGYRYDDGLVFSDYTTNYNSLYIVYDENRKPLVFRDTTDDSEGVPISIVKNPFFSRNMESVNDALVFIQFALNDVQEAGFAIYNNVKNMQFVPFTARVNDVRYDLGDVITFHNGLAGNESKGYVMGYEWNFKTGYTLHGFGANPAMQNGRAQSTIVAEDYSETGVYICPTLPNGLPEFERDTLVLEINSDTIAKNVRNGISGLIGVNKYENVYGVNRAFLYKKNIGFCFDETGTGLILNRWAKSVQSSTEIFIPPKMRNDGFRIDRFTGNNDYGELQTLSVIDIGSGEGSEETYGDPDLASTSLSGCKKMTIMPSSSPITILNLGSCQNLEIIDIQRTIHERSNAAFSGCTNLKTIYLRKSPSSGYSSNIGNIIEGTNVQNLYLDHGVFGDFTRRSHTTFSTNADKLAVYTDEIKVTGLYTNQSTGTLLSLDFVGDMKEITLPRGVEWIAPRSFFGKNHSISPLEILTIPYYNCQLLEQFSIDDLIAECPNLKKLRMYKPYEDYRNSLAEEAMSAGIQVEYMTTEEWLSRFTMDYTLSDKNANSYKAGDGIAIDDDRVVSVPENAIDYGQLSAEVQTVLDNASGSALFVDYSGYISIDYDKVRTAT